MITGQSLKDGNYYTIVKVTDVEYINPEDFTIGAYVSGYSEDGEYHEEIYLEEVPEEDQIELENIHSLKEELKWRSTVI